MWTSCWVLGRASLLLSIIFACAPSFGQNDCGESVRIRTEVGTWIRPHPGRTELSKAKEVQVYEAPTPGLRYLRPLIKVEEPGSSQWHLVVRDADGRVLQTFDVDDFKRTEVLFADRLRSPKLFLELWDADEQTQIEIPRIIAMPEQADEDQTFYSVADPDNPRWMRLYEGDEIPHSVRRLGDNVGFAMMSWDERVGVCSGIALPPNLFLTNWHCGEVLRENDQGEIEELKQFYWNKTMCEESLIDLSWDDDQVSREFKCVRVIMKDENLDYAFLEIAPLGNSRAIRPISISATRLETADQVRVLHHPAARRKVSSPTCEIVDAHKASWRGDIANVRFSHRCDTEAGSSGAPVFNPDGQLVGIHHYGFDVDPQTCEFSDSENKAVWIDAIVDDLRDKASQDDDLAGVVERVEALLE